VRKGLLGSITALLGGAGLTFAQAPAPPLPATPLAPAPPASAAESAHPELCVPPCAEDPGARFWVGADYLLWWTKGSPTPPLLITGPAPLPTGPIITTVPPPPDTGFVALRTITGAFTSLTPGASTGNVPSGNSIEDGVRTGGRFVVGGWLDPERTIGLEGSYFFLASRSMAFGTNSNGSPTVAIPYLNASTGQEAGYTIAQPLTTISSVFDVNSGPGVFVNLNVTTSTDASSGKAVVISTSRLQGSEANGVWSPDVLGKHLQLLAGFRYAQLDEGLGIASSVSHFHSDTTLIQPAFGLDNNLIDNHSTSLTTRWDQFDTHNNFYGAQVGARGEYTWGRLSVLAGAKVALGTMNESVDIRGLSSFSTTTTVTPTDGILIAGIPLTIPTGAPAVTTTTSGHSVGGLFAQPTNIGHYSRNVFAVVPEGNLKVGYQISERLRATVGYSFFYMSDVARPGEQIDRAINPGLLATPPLNGPPARPLFHIKSTDYWAQGVDFGLEFRF